MSRFTHFQCVKFSCPKIGSCNFFLTNFKSGAVYFQWTLIFTENSSKEVCISEDSPASGGQCADVLVASFTWDERLVDKWKSHRGNAGPKE